MIPIKKEFLQEFLIGILEKGDPYLESPSEKNLIYSEIGVSPGHTREPPGGGA